MRACCVSGCKSTGKVLSHQFPKKASRRMNWLQRLRLTEQNEDIINKLRVCHEHFKDSDYSYSINRRRLVDTAIPSINICEDQIETSQQETEIFQQEIDIHPEENHHQEPATTQVENITDHERLIQHDQSIQFIRQDIEMIKEQLQTQETANQEVLKEIMKEREQNTRKRRPNLLRITRKQNSPPIARKFYNSTIKLQKEPDD
ncbi:uncharacterized protein [Linepithema humile]|uniref:uncharacterized protein n=1 Tax=Linepithema humile TaxID=83485 RepID=UPI00351DE5BD